MCEKSWVISDKDILKDLLNIEKIKLINEQIKTKNPLLGQLCKIEINSSMWVYFIFKNQPSEIKRYSAYPWLIGVDMVEKLISIAEKNLITKE